MRRCVIELRYEPPYFPSELSVEVEGQAAKLSLLESNRGIAGLWGADVWTTPGLRSYRLLLDGRAILDPNQPLSIAESGDEYSLVRVPDCTRGRWFRVSTEGAGRERRFLLAFERGLSAEQQERAKRGEEVMGIPLDSESLRIEVDGIKYPASLDGEGVIVSTSGLSDGKHLLTLSASDERGTAAEVFQAPFWVETRSHRWTRGIMYQVVLDRLSPPQREGSQAIDEDTPSIGARWGGQLDGVTEMIESGYFERLGVRSLWISPLAPNPPGQWTGVEGGAPRYEGYHGYWAAAPRSVGSEWGGEESLERLISRAHERGLRVIVDVALNHVHESHPYVEDHPEWFYPPGCLCGRPGCDWGRYIETCRFTTYLPDFRWQGIEAMRVQVDDALWWLERFDLDGLRVDAVPMMPRRVTRLLSAESHRRFEGLRERHLLLGETFTGPQEWDRIGWYIGPQGLDGQFDFPWMWALREVIAWEAAPMWTLIEAWRSGEAQWSNAAPLMGLFTGNHDVSRFVSEAAGSDLSDPWERPPPQIESPEALGRLWIATALNYLLPGIPVLYYGDESGLSGANDPDNRRPYWPLGADAPLNLDGPRAQHFQRVAQLGKLRACLDGLSETPPQLTFLASDEERLSLIRGNAGEEVIAVIQRRPSATPTELLVPLSNASSLQDSWVDLLSGAPVEVTVKETELTAALTSEEKVLQFSLPVMSAYHVMLIAPRRLHLFCQELNSEPSEPPLD